jgi:hypothetical protein
MKLLDQESMPELFETVTESILKGIEESDLFKDTGFAEAVPFGKIAKYLTRKIIVISDPPRAVKKVIGVAGYKTFIDGLNYYQINPTVDKASFTDELAVIKQKLIEKTFEIDHFDIENFNNNELIQFFIDHLMLIINTSTSTRQKNLLRRYINDNYKINFFRIIDENTVVYEN